MDEIIKRLRDRAESYDQSGPSAKHTADLLRESALALVLSKETSESLRKTKDLFFRNAEAWESKYAALRQEIQDCIDAPITIAGPADVVNAAETMAKLIKDELRAALRSRGAR